MRLWLNLNVKVRGCSPLNYIICLEVGLRVYFILLLRIWDLLLFKICHAFPLVALWLHELIILQVSKYKPQHENTNIKFHYSLSSTKICY